MSYLNKEVICEEIKILKIEIANRQQRLEYLESILDRPQTATNIPKSQLVNTGDVKSNASRLTAVSALSNDEVDRYSRQLILPELGVAGQVKLKGSSVLIVGAGGLGCPSACYLAAAGIGSLGLVDYDTVEVNNLHRQVLHCGERVGRSKAVSLAHALRSLNPLVSCRCYTEQLSSANALDIITGYDVVLDCSDNLATRYLVNDACVLAGRPLVSGSALRMEGMLVVYNHGGGPCYRCLFPTPPPAHTVTNCAEGGVLGTVPGVIGVLQAMEAIKLILGLPVHHHTHMLLYDALEGRFRAVRLRPQSPNCAVCGTAQDPGAQITQLIDYTRFCGAAPNDKMRGISVLGNDERISSTRYKEEVYDHAAETPHVLLDVRSAVEYGICHVTPSINIPLTELRQKVPELLRSLEIAHTNYLYVMCHHGNDSQRAVRLIQQLAADATPSNVKDIVGGIHSWSLHVDTSCPQY